MNHLGKIVLAIKSERATCGCGKTNERGIAGCLEVAGVLDCACNQVTVEACEPYTPESREWRGMAFALDLDEQNRVTETTVQLVDGDEELWGFWFVLEE